MKKRVALAAALLLAMPLAACGSGDNKGQPNASGGEVTLHYWTWFPAEPAMTKAIDAFEADHPDIHVELTMADSADYQTKLPLALNNGEPIDLVGVQMSAMAEQVRASLRPIDSLGIGTDYQSVIDPVALEQAKRLVSDGNLYYLPLIHVGNVGMFYNPEILAKAGVEVPTTLEEMAAAAQTIKAKVPGVIPTVFPGDGWFQDEITSTLASQINPDFFNDIRYNDGSWNKPEYVTALTEYQHAFQTGAFSTDALDLDYGRASELFTTGKAAFYLQGTWEGGLLSSQYRTENKIGLKDVGFAPLPIVPGGTPTIRSFIEDGVAVPTSSEHPAEAAELLEYLAMGKGIDPILTAVGMVPARADYTPPEGLLTSDAAKSGYEAMRTLLINSTSDRNNVSEFSNVVGDLVKALASGGDAADTASKAEDEWESGRYN